MTEQQPHILKATIDPSHLYYGLTLHFECPYDPTNLHRPCLMFEEVVDCTGDCNGKDLGEFGHCHPTENCVLKQFSSEGSLPIGEEIVWEPGAEGIKLTLPAQVTMRYGEADQIFIKPVEAPQFGDRIMDGGLMGTLVRCPECGGTGALHALDEPLPVAIPTDPEEAG